MKFLNINISKKIILFGQIVGLLALGSCNGPSDSEDGFTIKTGGIFNKAKVSIDNDLEIGEIITGSLPVEYTITIRNNSDFEYSSIGVNFEINGDGFKFNKDNDGADTTFPGHNGTCASTLSSKSSCTVRMEYTPLRSGVFDFPFEVTFKNLVDIEKYEFSITATAGLPANLVYTVGQTVNSFGPVEQTDISKISTNFTVKNTGGLSAKNILIELIEGLPDPAKAYSFENINCPTRLKTGEDCEVRVDYTPRNNGDFDAPVEYGSNLKFSYNNEPNSLNIAYLNSYFTALSTKIQGVLTAPSSIKNVEYLDSEGLSEITVGKTLTNTFKVSNQGYKKAQVREIHVYDTDINSDYSDDTLLARCLMDSGEFKCFQPDFSGGQVEISKSDDKFPWVIEDNNNCLGVEILGPPPGSTLGGSCLFNLKFHPSVMTYYEKEVVGPSMVYNKTYSDNALKINKKYENIRLEFLYDSYWKSFVCDDMGTYLTAFRSLSCVNDSDMFKVTAVTKSQGLLDIKTGELTYGLEKRLANEKGRMDSSQVEDSYHMFDVGRRALILSEDYSTKISFALINKGMSGIRITKVYMYDESDNEVSMVVGGNYNNLGSYFKNVSTSCNKDYIMALGESCSFNADFAPLYIAGPSFDYTSYFYDNGKDYRSVFFEYEDSSCIEDEGSATGYTDDPTHDNCSEEKEGVKRPVRQFEFRIKGSLIQKGLLAFSKDPSVINSNLKHYDFDTDGVRLGVNPNFIIAGDRTHYHEIKITNVGTGPIPYIKFRQYNPDSPSDKRTYLLEPIGGRYPFNLVNMPASPTKKDCLVMFDKKNFSNETLDGSSNPSSFLFDSFEFMKNAGTIPSRLSPADTTLINNIKTLSNNTHLDSGDSCYLRVHTNQKDEARNIPISYDATETLLFRLESEKSSGIFPASKTYDLKAFGPWSGGSQQLSFEYFNGDSSAPALEQTVVGLGSLETITGPEGLDVFEIDVNFSSRGEIVPQSVLPFQSAVVYRPEYLITEVPYSSEFFTTEPAVYDPLDLGANFAFGVDEIDELFIYYAFNASSPSEDDANLIYHFPNIRNKSKSEKLLHQDGDGTPHFEYYTHFGTFEDGVTHSGLSLNFDRVGKHSNAVIEYDTDSGTLDDSGCGLNEIAPLDFPLIEFNYTPTFLAGDVSKCVRVIKISYENGIVKPDLTKEVNTYKIMLVAESRRNSSAPKPSFKYRNYDADGSTILPEVWEAFTVGTNNDTSLAADINFVSIVESEEAPATKGIFYAKKNIEIENLAGSGDLKNIKFYLKGAVGPSSNESYGMTESIIVNNGVTIENDAGCISATLAANQKCTFDIVYNPGEASAPSASFYLVMAYDFYSGVENSLPVVQRIEKIVRVNFLAQFPARSVAVDSPDYEIQTAPNGIDQTIKVNFGDIQITAPNHVEFSDNKTVNLKNVQTLGASLCRQWQIYQFDSFAVSSDTNSYLQNQKVFVDGVLELSSHGDYSIDYQRGVVYTKNIIGGGHVVSVNASYKEKSNESITFTVGENRHNVAYINTNCSPTIIGDFAVILDTDKLKIEAHKSCFFGAAAANATDVTLGYPLNAVCELKTAYKATFRDIYYSKRNQKYGYEINPEMKDQCDVIQYYSYNRELKSSKDVEICAKAYIYPEPNLTASDSDNWINVDSKNNSGTVTITLEVEEASYDVGSVWGNVEKYALYVKASESSLKKIYRNEFQNINSSSITDQGGISYFKVLDLNSVTPGYISTEITSLPDGSPFIPGIYYDFKIFSMREYAGTYYLSDMKYDTISILVPPEGTFYDYANSRLVDVEPVKNLSGSSYDVFTRTEAISKCNTSKYTLTRKGLPTVVSKKLFTSAEVSFIKLNKDLANDYNYWEVGHWLGDPKRNIEFVWSTITPDPFNSSPFAYSGCIGPFDGLCGQRVYLPADPTPESASLMYNRECGNDSDCNNLYSAYGGIELFNQDFFTFDDTLEFTARCWATVP